MNVIPDFIRTRFIVLKTVTKNKRYINFILISAIRGYIHPYFVDARFGS